MFISVSPCLLIVLWGWIRGGIGRVVLNLYWFSVFYMTSLYTVNVQTFSTLIKCYYNYKDPHSYRDRKKNGTKIWDFVTSHFKKSFTILIRKGHCCVYTFWVEVNMHFLFIVRLYLYCLEIQLSRGKVEILSTSLTLPHFVTVPCQDMDFQLLMSWPLFFLQIFAVFVCLFDGV